MFFQDVEMVIISLGIDKKMVRIEMIMLEMIMLVMIKMIMLEMIMLVMIKMIMLVSMKNIRPSGKGHFWRAMP